MTVMMILAVWFAVSVPVSVAVGCVLRARTEPELLGMVGSDAVFVRADGRFVRLPLGEAAPL
jgi:hypothetical protein